jgi:L,D-transpeptidase YcbB
MTLSMFRFIAGSRLRNQLAVAFVCALSTAGCSTTGFDLDSSNGSSRQKLGAPREETPEAELHRFYASRDNRPAWTGSDKARARAASVIAALQHADRQGLIPHDYAVTAAPDTAQHEQRITASLLRYAHDVRTGRVAPKAAYDDAQMPAQNFDAAAELESALENERLDKFLAELPPQHPQYRALAGALVRYQAIAAKGGWPSLPAQTAPQKLAKRLALEDAKLAKKPSATDIKAALQRFQARHGLPEDGVLGSDTLKALNVPVSNRIAEITANMERWRWLPRKLEDRYIQVDVPEQTVDFVENGKSVLHSRAIIGSGGENRTPILRTAANAIVVNPPWDIPDDIAAKAILPKLRKDPNYLAKRNMVLVDAPQDDPTGTQINWREVKGDNLPYQIREQPGPHNVLGAVMLDMPNDFDVYLHGTSNAATFNLKDRERSHGCVRVEKVVDLAALALQDSMSHPRDTLAQNISSGQTERVPLDQPIPVYMVYWTAHVGKDGAVAFRPDRYDRDPPLVARLMKRS